MLLRLHTLQMLQMRDRIVEDFKNFDSKPVGWVHLGGIESRHLHRLAQVVRFARSDNSGIRIHYHTGNFADVSMNIERGLLDFGIVVKSVDTDKYNSCNLAFREHWVACMRDDNPLADKPYIMPQDLMAEPLVMYDQMMQIPTAYNSLAMWFGELFSELNVVATSNLSYSNNTFVTEGLGTLITLSGLEPPASDVVVRPLKPPVTSEVRLIWSKDRPLSPVASYFLDLIRRYMVAT